MTIQYRLGALGWAAEPSLRQVAGNHSGNNGMLDQIEALRWVSKNAAAFAGDPGNVTIFGESAGGMSVCTLLASPKATGLFHRAIIESGSCQARPLADQEKAGIDLFKKLGCAKSDAKAQVACLESLKVGDIVRLQPNFGLEEIGIIAQQLSFLPAIDGEVLVEAPFQTLKRGAHHHVPVIIGTNINEVPGIGWMSDADLLKRATDAFQSQAEAQKAIKAYKDAGYTSNAAIFGALSTDVKFQCPKYEIAKTLAAQGEAIWSYRFDYQNAFHGFELAFVFGKDETNPVIKAMHDYWTTFAKDGKPSSPASPWSLYDAADPADLRINTTSKVVPFDRAPGCDQILASKARIQ